MARSREATDKPVTGIIGAMSRARIEVPQERVVEFNMSPGRDMKAVLAP